MGPCCVDGCNDVQEDTVFFEFPASRALRKRWLDVLKISSKLPLGSVVCSHHFNKESYEIVRGKVRLKRKVVPSLHLNSKSSVETALETLEKLTENSVLPDENKPENGKPPQPDSTTDNIGVSNTTDNIGVSNAIDNIGVSNAINNMEGSDLESPAGSIINEAIRGKSPNMFEVNGARTSIRNSGDRVPLIPDPKQPPDFEDMITNYQIKISKPNALMRKEIEIEIPAICDKDDAIVLDGEEDAPPVFIEINVDKDTNTTNEGAEDCLMVLESVQCDIDPTSLMLPEQDLDEEQLVEVDLSEPDKSTEKKEDPISLLTSSDESDVILQEPKIDTVEVSDETDEDDMPLVKLVKTTVKKNKKRKNKRAGKIKTLMWGAGYDFYCMACHFNTSDGEEYNIHLAEHHKVLQVCSICNYTTASKAQLTRHTRKHKEEKRYRCHLCEYRARHNMSLIYHLQSHEKEKKLVKVVKKGFKCKKCGFKSDTESVVLKHVRSCDTDDAKYSCDLCSFKTRRKSELKKHWRTVHDKNDGDTN